MPDTAFVMSNGVETLFFKNEDRCYNKASCETADSIDQFWVKSKFGGN